MGSGHVARVGICSPLFFGNVHYSISAGSEDRHGRIEAVLWEHIAAGAFSNRRHHSRASFIGLRPDRRVITITAVLANDVRRCLSIHMDVQLCFVVFHMFED